MEVCVDSILLVCPYLDSGRCKHILHACDSNLQFLVLCQRFLQQDVGVQVSELSNLLLLCLVEDAEAYVVIVLVVLCHIGLFVQQGSLHKGELRVDCSTVHFLQCDFLHAYLIALHHVSGNLYCLADVVGRTDYYSRWLCKNLYAEVSLVVHLGCIGLGIESVYGLRNGNHGILGRPLVLGCHHAALQYYLAQGCQFHHKVVLLCANSEHGILRHIIFHGQFLGQCQSTMHLVAFHQAAQAAALGQVLAVCGAPHHVHLAGQFLAVVHHAHADVLQRPDVVEG